MVSDVLASRCDAVAGVVKEIRLHQSAGFQLCCERVDGDQHHGSLRILNRLQYFEANRPKGLAENPNVIEPSA